MRRKIYELRQDFNKLCADANEKLVEMLKYFPDNACTFSEPIMTADGDTVTKMYLYDGVIILENENGNTFFCDETQFPQVLAFLTMVDMEMMRRTSGNFRSVR